MENPEGRIWFHSKNKHRNTKETLTTHTNGTVSLRGFACANQIVAGEGSGTGWSSYTLNPNHENFRLELEQMHIDTQLPRVGS